MTALLEVTNLEAWYGESQALHGVDLKVGEGGESGAGLVKVVMTCKHDVKRITIDPSLLADDKDMLEDLVAAAFNAAVRKAEETSAEKMGKITAGMPGLPGGMKFPF